MKKSMHTNTHDEASLPNMEAERYIQLELHRVKPHLSDLIMAMRLEVLTVDGPEDPIAAFCFSDFRDEKAGPDGAACFEYVLALAELLVIGLDEIFEYVREDMLCGFPDALIDDVNEDRILAGFAPLATPYVGTDELREISMDEFWYRCRASKWQFLLRRAYPNSKDFELSRFKDRVRSTFLCE